MKVGIYTPYLDTLTGGEKYILTIAACLAKKNEVFLFWDTSKEAEIKKIALEKLAIDIHKVKFTDNIFTPQISLTKRLHLSSQYDFIIFLSDGSIPLVWCRLFIHIQFPVEWVKINAKLLLKVARVEKFICNSVFTKNYIDKKFKVNSSVLYPPISVPDVKKIMKENIILNVGRFAQGKEGENFKKQDILIEVFKEMIDKGMKSWEFVLVLAVKPGDEEKFEKLKSLAKGYPVKFFVNIKNEELWQIYEKSKIYWHATGYGEDMVAQPERAEHFGISTVEAMSKGAVPVVINAGGQKEIVTNNENGFLWETKDECIQATQALITDSNLLHKLSEQAIKKAETFSKTDFCKELSAIVEKSI